MPALLLDVAVRAVLIAGVAAFILWALRIHAAAGRHAAWTTVVVAMLLLPLWSLAGPRISLPILPGGVGSAETRAAGKANLEVPPPGDTWGIRDDGRGSAANSRSIQAMWVALVVYLAGALLLLGRLAIGTLHAR